VRGFNDLETVYDSSEFLDMTFYFGAPYSTPVGNARASWYGFNGTPSVMFGGTGDFVGGAASGSMFSSYNPTVISQLGTPSPLVMSASYVLVGGTEIELTLQIDVDQALGGANNQVLFFICQEGLHDQSNMVVSMLTNEPFILTTPGQSVTINKSFTMNPSWNEPDLRIISIVQNMATKEIHQATLAVADYAAQVVIDAEPDGVEAPWTLTGPDLAVSGNGDYNINLWAVGDYTVTWGDLPVWQTPANNPETQAVAEDGIITFTGTYTNGPFTPSTADVLNHAGQGRAVSLIDVDNDGDLDLHVVNEDAVDQLLRNDGNNTFTDIAAGPIAEAGPGRGAAWADINGDGFMDVLLACNNEPDMLMVGDGSGGFSLATTFGMDVVGPSSSASFIDFNLDGIMDIYTVYDGEANILLKGMGGAGNLFVFGVVSGEAQNTGHGSAAVWLDGNLDGRPDLFIANQFGNNVYLENTTIGFSDLTMSCGIGENLGKAMGAAAGDYDNDGDFDLYVANEGMADLLYRCTGTFQYTQMAGANLGDRGDARGVVWVDLNNDTFLDLYVVRNNQPDLMLMGDGAGNFLRVPVGPPEADGPGNAIACGDIDDDGDMDLFISREGAANALLVNEMSGDNRWIKLHLTAPGNNSCAIGARVVLTAGGVSQTRLVTAGSGYLANSAMGLHFGLGTATQVDQIEIFWPGGDHQILGPTFTNHSLHITQGQGLTSGVEDGIPARATALGLAHPNPFNPSTTIDFALAAGGQARVDVFTVDGRHVTTLVDRTLDAGDHAVTWNGTDQAGRAVGSGTYFYRLTTAAGFHEAGRMVLVK